jgi:hypothetical protein
MTRQYYYKVNDCKATDARDPDCICWHDEGTGPLSTGNFKPIEWRDKPMTAPDFNDLALEQAGEGK